MEKGPGPIDIVVGFIVLESLRLWTLPPGWYISTQSSSAWKLAVWLDQQHPIVCLPECFPWNNRLCEGADHGFWLLLLLFLILRIGTKTTSAQKKNSLKSIWFFPRKNFNFDSQNSHESWLYRQSWICANYEISPLMWLTNPVLKRHRWHSTLSFRSVHELQSLF